MTAKTFTIGHATAASGTIAGGTLGVPAHHDHPGTAIPFTIVHGAQPGPVLLLVAGIHAMEYAPIIALQRLRTAIDPKTLHGTVIMVHVANMPMFFGRRTYYSPVDGQNLNRVFPGKPNGTMSERIADVLTREVISLATHVLDLHGGDGNEALRPFSYWITTGDPAVAEASRAMALAFGLDHIVVDRARPTDPAASMYLSNTAITRGKPAVTTETGGLGRVEDDAVALIESGVAGVMRHLGMRADGPAPVANPKWISNDAVLRAGTSGIFYGAVEPEQMVTKGALLGHITDFHGHTLEDFHAPFDGEVIYVIGTPPITKGEPVVMIGAASAN